MIINGIGKMKCSRCGFTIDTTHNFCSLCGGVSEGALPNKNFESVPWESSYAKDYPLRAFLDTIQESFFKTDHFFSKVQKSSNKPALLYGILCGSIGVVSTFLWSFFLPDPYKHLGITETANNLILTPLVLIIQILLTTVYVHFMLIIFRSTNAPISSTFRISSYSLGAFIMNAIPAIGPLLTTVLWFYLIITGIHQIHHIGRLKAFAAMILPLLLLFIVVFFIVVIVGSIAALNLYT
jgi:hypothetical protein